MPGQVCPKPSADAPVWQQDYWTLGEGVNFFSTGTYTIRNWHLFFVINIGVILMSAMGKLAVELSTSVREYLPNFKESRFFCTRLTYKCKMRTVLAIELLFVLQSVVYLVISSYLLSKYGQFAAASTSPY
jgi:hypothetical protein